MSTKLTDEPIPHSSRSGQPKRFDPTKSSYYGYRSGVDWSPAVNLYETDHAYLICVDLAGVDKSKIDLTVVDHQLRVRGVRPVPRPPAHADSRVRVHLMEIDHDGFSRDVELPPDVAETQINAQYVNGLLWIELPRRP